MDSTSMRTFLLAGWISFVFALAGCGERQIYPVRGQIVDKQGNPVIELKGATVQFEHTENKASAYGVVDEKGQFRLSTNSPGDGALPGKHRVAVVPMDTVSDIKPAPVINRKYESFDTSGLTETVEKRDNVIKLEVERYKR